MKFKNYILFMRLLNGLIVEGWELEKMELDGAEVTRAFLTHKSLKLSYILEHHTHQVTFNESILQPYRDLPIRKGGGKSGEIIINPT